VPGVGIAVLWFGYSLVYYGYTQVTGGNWGYLDLVLPSRSANAVSNPPPHDGGGTGTPGAIPGGGVNVSTQDLKKAGLPPNTVKSPALRQAPTPIR
jgi:hypothetical protein